MEPPRAQARIRKKKKKRDEVGEEEKEKRQRSKDWELGLVFGSSLLILSGFLPYPDPAGVSSSPQITDSITDHGHFKSHIVKRRVIAVRFVRPLAAALLLLVGLRGEVDSAAHRWVRARLARVQSLAGNDAVDFWGRVLISCCLDKGLVPWPRSVVDLPVRMFWKASSTLLASRAEVSMKERLFSPVESSQPSRPYLIFHRGKLKTYWQIAWPPRWGPHEGGANRSCYRPT